MKYTSHGFTLVEMAIVLIIIGLLGAGILGAQSLIRVSQVNHIVALVSEIRGAAEAFRGRYGYLPGDCPAEVPDCAAMNPGNGDGSVDGAINANGQIVLNSEAHRAPEQLYGRGFLARIDTADSQRSIRTKYGPLHITTAANAGVAAYPAANPMVRHTIVLVDLPCEIAQEVDSKLDNNDIVSGRAAAQAVCAEGDIVPRYAIAL